MTTEKRKNWETGTGRSSYKGALWVLMPFGLFPRLAELTEYLITMTPNYRNHDTLTLIVPRYECPGGVS